MNIRMLTAVVVLSMFLCQQVHAQDEEPEQAEETELEGIWETVSLVPEGKPYERAGAPVRFVGDNWCHMYGGRFWGADYKFSVNPSAMPAEIDIEILLPDDTIRTLGIYELDGDSLTICVAIPEEFEPGTRPDRFESSEDYPTRLYVLRRVEENDE